MNVILLLKCAGIAHLGLMAAGALMPQVVQLPNHLRSLPPFVRQLFWVYYAFIGLCLVSFGAGSFFLAEELTSGTPIARSLCAFLAVFWTLRLVVAAFVFDLKPYLTHPWRRVGLAAANIVFAILPILYASIAWKGAAL